MTYRVQITRSNDDGEYHGKHRQDGWQPSKDTEYDTKVRRVIRDNPDAIGSADGNPDRGSRPIR